MDQQEFLKLKQKRDKLQSKKDQAEGVLQTLKEQLDSEFGIQEIKTARTVLLQMRSGIKQLEERLQELITKFEEEFGEKLDE